MRNVSLDVSVTLIGSRVGMSLGRRNNDRRRRVLYSSHHADTHESTAQSRRKARELREARRPAAAYGARVHRRLRGRWFSVVPRRRRTMIAVTTALVLIACGLGLAHYAAVAWPSVAGHPELARPLRLDRPDSFGRWLACGLLVGSAGASLLIYQLRRYRLDDYEGHYRIWRLVLVISLLTSINVMAGIVPWCGAMLDLWLGQRVALSGSNWLQLILCVAASVLALRLLAEVRRSRTALLTMAAGWFCLAVPAAASWNVISASNVFQWTLITAAPLFGYTALFVSLGCYLRMLYREVKELDEGDSLAEKWSSFRAQIFPTPRANSQGEPAETALANQEHGSSNDERVRSPRTTNPSEHQDGRRGWLSFGRGKPKSDSKSEPKTKRRFSMRLRPAKQTPAAPERTASAKPSGTTANKPAKPKRSFRWPWQKRAGEANERPSAAKTTPAKPAARPEQNLSRNQPSDRDSAAGQSTSTASDDQQIDGQDVDWSNLSKAERRRLRKQLKRRNSAA